MTASRLARWALGLLLTAALVAAGAGLGLFWLLKNPGPPMEAPVAAPGADPARLEAAVRFLAAVEPPRNGQNAEGLDKAAAYIAQAFAAAGCDLREQPFELDHVTYRNVVCSFGPSSAPRVVLGAHYDVAGDSNPGADDNASGVAGLLELARLLGRSDPSLSHRIDLVAFTLEEPPYFHTEQMGSHRYARSLFEAGVVLKVMVTVEMIGFFSDAPGSQGYPVGALAWIYPDRGDFIGVVGRAFDRSEVARVRGLMAGSDDLPVHSINAPAALVEIDFSDHWSFWQFGYPAVMVTDTAFYRNPNYHRPSDLPETLDYRRMALTVEGLYRVAVGF